MFSQPDFVRLWVAGLATFTVRWIEVLAISVFVYQQTGSELIVAIMMMWRVLPMALFGAFLGAWSDRIERRSALLLILLISLATSLGIGLLAAAGRLEIWHLGAASFVNGIAWCSDNPVRRNLMSQVVGRARLGAAMAVDVGSNNASRVLGPSLGGLLLVQWGIEGVFFCGALIYLLGLVAAFRVTYRNEPRDGASANILRQVADGWREACSNDQLRGIFAITFLFNLFCWPTISLIPVIGESALHLSPEWVGILSSADGVGTLAGALFIGTLAPQRWFGPMFVGGAVIYPALMAVFAMTVEPISAGAALVAVGIGAAGFSVMQATLVLTATPPPLRGSVLGLLSVCIGVAPMGLLLIGAVARAIGAPGAVIAFGVLGAATIIATYPVWRAVWRGEPAPAG
ncbi:MFS transporter [Enterovirga rhinocerotis]|uniref:Putative MFS family arabinose efflux permease n=1 Tax=Enterovirga rhinocerotis TaxID=1339210 RepID=A0A4R7C5E5_9HYPH|nr:MFS transporter [Enterovirga rhinocerotis]TDR93112.1 putative MFS family arabinose efflux permease [Enterovirga rhinocerotis]